MNKSTIILKRIFAQFIDGILLGIAIFFVFYIGSQGHHITFGISPFFPIYEMGFTFIDEDYELPKNSWWWAGDYRLSGEDNKGIVAIIIRSPLLLVIYALYYTLLTGLTGQTLGKKLFKIKVIQIDEKRVNYKISFFRWMCYLISLLPLSIGFLWAIWDKQNQCWHDKIMKTLVIIV